MLLFKSAMGRHQRKLSGQRQRFRPEDCRNDGGEEIDGPFPAFQFSPNG
jgi:hypothetical protein